MLCINISNKDELLWYILVVYIGTYLITIMSKLRKLKLNSMQCYYEQTKALFMTIQLIHIYIY